jgi:hypothetical protein
MPLDIVKMPFGLDLPVGAVHGAGVVVLQDGIKDAAGSLCGAAILPAAFCWALRPVRPWCWCGAIWPGAMMD